MSTSTLDAHFEQFSAAQACWFASTRSDGRAHLAPIWHVVYEDCIYVVTQASSIRSANIAVHPEVCLSLPDPMNALIIEGIARFAPELEAALHPLFQEKYAWNISTDADYDVIIGITPRKVMAWGDHGEGRWHLTSNGAFIKVR